MRSLFPLVAALTLACLACGEAGSPERDQAAPTPEERLLEWEAQPEGTSVPVALGFGGPLPDSVIAALLTRYSVRPYAVYLVAAGMGSSLRRERSRASLEVIGEAREQAISQLRTSLCAQPGRNRAMLEEGVDADATRDRAALALVTALQRSVPELERGAPTIYGLEAVGSVADVRALRDAGEVVTWEPGWRGIIAGVDTVVVPQPPAAPQIGPVADSSILALSAAEARARLVELTENRMGSCEDDSPSDEPR